MAVAAALLAGCAPAGLAHEQAAEEIRTCASLRERVAARALEDRGLVDADPAGPKASDLDPRTLARDPEAFYAALDEALTDAGFGPSDDVSGVSPASRLVQRCRALPG